jgi:hypothetical protein
MVSPPDTPVPVKAKYTRLFVALLPNTTYPLVVAAVRGANFTVKVLWAPGDSVKGRLKPLRLYIFACKLSSLKVTLAVPVLVIVVVMLFVVPTGTFPKFAAVGLKDRVPAPCALLAVRPARHVRNTLAIKCP